MASSAFQRENLHSNLIKDYIHLHSFNPRYWLYAVLCAVFTFLLSNLVTAFQIIHAPQHEDNAHFS